MGIVPAFDVAEDGHAGLGMSVHHVSVEKHALEAGEEQLAHGVAEGVANSAHRCLFGKRA